VDRIESGKLRRIARILAEHPPEDLFDAVVTLKRARVRIEPEYLASIANATTTEHPAYVFPHDLAKFIADIIAIRSPQSILDPYAGIGVLPLTVAKAVRPNKYVAVVQDDDEYRALQELAPISNIKVLHRAAHQRLKEEASYEAVVTCPPFRAYFPMPSPKEGFTDEDGHRFDPGRVLLLEGVALLSNDGWAVCVVPSVFAYGEQYRPFREALKLFDLHLHACIEVPAGAAWHDEQLPVAIVVLKKSRRSTVFVGQYVPDGHHLRTLLANLASNRPGGHVTQGCLADLTCFRGMQPLMALGIQGDPIR